MLAFYADASVSTRGAAEPIALIVLASRAADAQRVIAALHRSRRYRVTAHHACDADRAIELAAAYGLDLALAASHDDAADAQDAPFGVIVAPLGGPDALDAAIARARMDGAWMDGAWMDGARGAALAAARLPAPACAVENVSRLVAHVVEASTARCRARGQTLRLTSDVDPVFAQIDRAVVRAILEPCITQASEQGACGATIEVMLWSTSDSVGCAITDPGDGMSEAHIEAALAPTAPGGLAKAAAAADHSGGRLGVRSRPGLGATVTVTFPKVRSRARRHAR